jgi:hypothetical protein
MRREHIIAEIQRTAALNGGVALGVRRFFTETGIRDTDWSGKYWLRWSEALKEAGFEPNDFTESYSDEALLDTLAGYVRELGHFPIRAELLMKARTDRTFASEKTYRRFGLKQDLAARLLAHSIARGYADVAAICEPVLAMKLPDRDEEPKHAGEDEFGFVYLIKFGPHYKIGRTNALGRRERELAIQLPKKTNVVHSIRTDDPVGIEEYWHKRFHSRRKNGEWFALSSEDVAAFRRRKFM